MYCTYVPEYVGYIRKIVEELWRCTNVSKYSSVYTVYRSTYLFMPHMLCRYVRLV